MIHLAHLSDIHFGIRFSTSTWEAVVRTVIDFDPDLIVVSGDLVDDPSPAHLLAAKRALADLLEQTRAQSKGASNGFGRTAELFVIPGNHDVFEAGVAVGLKRLSWFERIFHDADTTTDTSRAEAALSAALNVDRLGFNNACLGLSPHSGSAKKLVARLRAIFSSWINVSENNGPNFTAYLPGAGSKPRVTAPKNSPVLLALLDSNPAEPGFFAATGIVENDQLIGLQAELAEATRPFVARIAVVHHHVLPIAFGSGVTKATGEPMMVLRNAGAVLRTLADHKFDLILHGHWHKAQLARIDFGSREADSYPIIVAAAGSAAMHSQDNPSANCLNLIRISENGRISVKSVFYGASQAPNPNGELGVHYRLFQEEMSDAKRRAYARARERHPIESDLREQFCEITENGDLWVAHRADGLRLTGKLGNYPKRPFGVSIPEFGHFVRETLSPDEASSYAGVTLSEAPEHPDSKDGRTLNYWINLAGGGLTQDGSPSKYGILHGCANCMIMTRWEAREKASARNLQSAALDREFFGARVTFPTRMLRLILKFPPSLVNVQPLVEARRSPAHPDYKIDQWGDAEVKYRDMIVDGDAQGEEQALRYDAAARTWTIEIDRPIVGYAYSLSWEVPTVKLDPQIAGETKQWQIVLMNLKNRVDIRTLSQVDHDAIKQFDLLCDGLTQNICTGYSDEFWIITLFSYDSKTHSLRSVLSRRSWSKDGAEITEVPFGSGVSGAAFQQRRIVTWRSMADQPRWGDSLIKPFASMETNGGPVEMVNVLALPIYHSVLEDKRRPPPGSVIGVVTIGSSSYASPIVGMSDEQLRIVRAVAQPQVYNVLDPPGLEQH